MKNLLLPKVVEVIDKYNIDCEVIACDSNLADTAAFCEAYGYKPEESANTIIVSSRKIEPPIYAVCVVLANTRLDVNKAVVKQLGVKKASFTDAETTTQLSGMEIGGVTALGIEENISLLVDGAVMKCKRIIMGGGNRTSKILLSPAELKKLPNCTVIENLAKASE
jgi:prolyl-tRNA editing enzyme YbaK/EbsC (Cys-tRNA(Pro) deacylase)